MQLRGQVESAWTGPATTRTIIDIRNSGWRLSSNGNLWSTTADVGNQNQRLLGQDRGEGAMLWQQGGDLPKWILWMDGTMVERGPHPNISRSPYHTDQPRSTTQTYSEDTTTAWFGQRRAYRINQTTSGTFPKMETPFTTGKATTLLFSSTTPRRRGRWLDTVTVTAKRTLRLRQPFSVRFPIFFFRTFLLMQRWNPFDHDLIPQPFTIMIRIPFERDRLSHGHLVHPVELAHLVHYWDSRKSIERDQRHALEACSSELRKMAPLVEELVNIPSPDHPLHYLVPNITAMLTDLRREVDSRITATQQAFAPIPTPFTPYDACGRMRGLHDNYPAPLLRKFVYPRSRSAPPTVDRKRTPQPWFHASTRNLRSPPSSPDSLQSIHHDRRNWLTTKPLYDSSTTVCYGQKMLCCLLSCLQSVLCLLDVAGAKLRTPIHCPFQRFPIFSSLENLLVLEFDVSPPYSDASTWWFLSTTSSRHKSLHDQCTSCLIELQESFQLWRQLQVAKLHHCLEVLDQLETNSIRRPIDITANHQTSPGTHHEMSETSSISRTSWNHRRNNQDPQTVSLRTFPRWTVPAYQTVTPSRFPTATDH